MKVLEINKLYHPWIGGVETVVKQISEGLQKNNLEVEVLAVNEKKEDKKTVIQNINGIKVSKTKLNFFFGALPVSFKFFKELKKAKAEVFHFHLPNPLAVIAALIAKPKGVWIVTYHSDIVKQKILRIFYWPFLKLFLKKVKKIVATSSNLIDSSPILSKFKDKTTVIPLGIDPAKYTFDPKIVEKIVGRYGENFLLAVGRLVTYKGFKYLVKVMKYIPNQKLYIIGDGPLLPDLNKIIQSERSNEKVIILKSISFEELKAFFKLCKIFVLPSVSNNEAFGIVQLEAMFFGKPVISSDLKTGVTFVNRDTQTGIVVPKKNVNLLAKAINGLLKNNELYEKIAANNKKYILDNFTEELMVTKYEELINNLPRG